MAEGSLPIRADTLSTRRWLGLTYLLMTLGVNRRANRPPEELASWVYRVRRGTGWYDERMRHWGNNSCWSLAAPMLQAAHFFGSLVEHQVADDGCRMQVRLFGALAPDVAGRCGAEAGDERRTLRAYWDLASREYHVRLRWETAGDGVTIVLGQRGAPTPDAPSWAADLPGQQPDVGRRLVARYLGILLGYADGLGDLPEQVGRLLATRLGPLLAPSAVWDQEGPGLALARVAEALHLGLLDEAEVVPADGGWLVRSSPLAPATAGVLQVYGVLPHDLGRFFNGLLQALGASHQLRVAAEIGQSTFRTRIRER